MPSDISKLRSPSQLEALFYQELLAPLHDFAASLLHDPPRRREAKLLAQRFKKDIVRYGYVLTERGAMMQVEPDILDTTLDAAHRAMLVLDMQILDRLIDRP
jgi:hypothetical protein